MLSSLPLLALLALALPTRAETSAQYEQQAEQAVERQSWDDAQKFFRLAGEQRLKECAIYEAKPKDDFALSSDPSDSDDEGEALPGANDAMKTEEADRQAHNYIRAAYDFERGAKPRRCDACRAKAEAVKGVSPKIAKELADLATFIAKGRDPTEFVPPPPKPRDPFKKLSDLKADVARLASAKAASAALAKAWSKVGYEAFLHHRDDVMREAVDAISRLGQKPSELPGRWVKALACYDNLKSFPKPETATAAPKTLDDLGVKPKQTLVAGELDWNADDATACVEEALASGATTVIFEDRGSPWYVRQIRPRSNQRLVFKKGVRIYMDRVSCQNNDKSALVQFKDVQNVILEGEGEPGDVVIAKFPDKAARTKWQPKEGGSGFSISGSRRIVIRNLTSSWNSCDGLSIGGSAESGPSSDIWLENVVFDHNYRQGMSVCDCAGLYCRNVSFLDTFGGEPMCGVDLEENFDTDATSDCYFYDCTFGGNIGGAINWSAGGYFPVTAHMKRCRFLKAPTPHQVSIQARDWSSRLDNMRAPGKLVFEDCDMAVNTGTVPFSIRNSNAYDIEITNCHLRDLGPRSPAKPEQAWSALSFSLNQDDRWWGRDSTFDFARNSGRVAIRGLVVEGFGDKFKPIGFSDSVGSYSVTNVTAEATINGKPWPLQDYCYNAPERGWGIVAPFNPADYLPPSSQSTSPKSCCRTLAVSPTPTSTPDTPAPELPATFKLNWRGPWWDPAPEYRALYYQNGSWQMKLIQDGVRELDLGTAPVAYACRSKQSRFKIKALKTPVTVYFEVPANCGACHLKVQGDAVLKNPSGETLGETQRWKNKYLNFTASPTSQIYALTLTSSSATIWFYPPLSGIIAEDPNSLPRKK